MTPESREARERRQLVDTLLLMTRLVSARDQSGSLVSRVKAQLTRDVEGKTSLDSLTEKDFQPRVDL